MEKASSKGTNYRFRTKKTAGTILLLPASVGITTAGNTKQASRSSVEKAWRSASTNPTNSLLEVK